jgi:hypothetical protein
MTSEALPSDPFALCPMLTAMKIEHDAVRRDLLHLWFFAAYCLLPTDTTVPHYGDGKQIIKA